MESKERDVVILQEDHEGKGDRMVSYMGKTAA